MKVLHIIDSEGMYGAEVMLLNLMKEHKKIGIDPILASIGEKQIEEKSIEKEASERGFQVEKFRIIPGPNLAGAINILKYAHKNDVDLLHSHGYKGNILLGFIPKKYRRIPMISTLHGYTSTTGFTKMRFYEWIDLFSHRFIDQMVLVNKGMLGHPKLKNQNRISYHVINNGISISPSRPINSSNPKLEDFCMGRFVIGSIGRFSKEKGYNYLIEAFSVAIKKGLDAYLVIIGEGYEGNALKQMVMRLGLNDRVLFPGYLRDAGNYISLFHVYAIPSLTEGLPITLLEAMRSKTPIVASNVGGIPDVLKNGAYGHLFPRCDINALSKSLFHIYRHYEKSKVMASKGYTHFVDKYSSSNMAKEYLHLYNEMGNKNGRAKQ